MRNHGIAIAAVLLASLWADRAGACGGFFCSQSTPIDQTGERIVFTHDEDSNLVTYVQIQYQGSARDFSWVLPVPGIPTVGVGTDAIFQRLDAATAPSFVPRFHVEGTCEQEDYGDGGGDDGGCGGCGGGAGGSGGGGGGVTVVDQRQVGPYDQATLAASDPDALLAWLDGNGYDVTERGQELLRLYVDETHHFVALKLQQDRGVGDLVPIVLRYDEPLPCVPIRLTAVAAQPDMGITAWVLADRRAVPLNYFHVRINEARIDWLGYGSNYRDVLSEAVDAAPNGQAFATEYAGPSSIVRGGLVPAGFDEEALRASRTAIDYLNQLIQQGFAGDAQLLAFLRRWIPAPPGIDEQDFYNCLECYEEAQGLVVDAEAATDDLVATMIEPAREAEALLRSQPYLTRLSTTMSPDEMTTDPYFTYNLDLGDVSNEHAADVTIHCGDGGRYGSSPITIELADGTVIGDPDGFGRTYGTPGFAEAGPAALLVEQLGDSGPGVVTEDLSGQVDRCIRCYVGGPGFGLEHAPGSREEAASGCGCDAGAGAGPALLGLAALLLRRRRACRP